MSRWGTNTGHGHVWERPDGITARCGGPGMCSECASDLANHTSPEASLAKAVLQQNQFNALHLRRRDPHVILEIEIDGKWHEIIRERLDSNFGHIIEPSGIAAAIRRSNA